MRLPDGRVVEGRSWGWRQRGCPITDGRAYAPEMARRGLQRQTLVGQATLTLFRLNDCFAVVAGMLASGHGHLPSCARCTIRPKQTAQDAPSDWDEVNECLMPCSAALAY
jgi:hypothetical protein